MYSRVGPVTTRKRTGNHAWRELGALTVPKLHPAGLGPGGGRQGSCPQLLTVSGAPLHGLWLCLIEEQGYEGHQPSLEPGQIM